MPLTATRTPTIEVVACDYGGVLTNPIAETFLRFEAATGISAAQIGGAMARVLERDGRHPMAELETGRITEQRFLDLLADGMGIGGAAAPAWLAEGFGRTWFAGRVGNEAFVAYLRTLRARGLRLALLTNNVREWEPLWRATVPADELFDVVVNSAHEGTRKPEPAIYERLLERLGVAPERCLFVDDLEENCAAARRLGMPAIRFATTEQAVTDIDCALERRPS
jgi:putative hydrolase of the HAD superfamily